MFQQLPRTDKPNTASRECPLHFVVATVVTPTGLKGEYEGRGILDATKSYTLSL